MSATTSPRVARAAIAQLRSTRDKQSNLMNVAKCAGWAQRDGAQMMFLPECLGFMGDSAEHTLNQADPPIIELKQHCETPPPQTPFRRALADTIASYARMEGNDADDVDEPYGGKADGESFTSIIEELRFIACEAKLWISGGGVHTTVPPSDIVASTPPSERKIYNTHVIIDSDGQIKAYYHKVHLFDVSIPGINLRESNTTAPGKRLVVCDSPIGKLGLSICYDMRFSEMYVDLVQKGGAEVLLMPSAFTVPTGKAHWHTLLRGKVENSVHKFLCKKHQFNFLSINSIFYPGSSCDRESVLRPSRCPGWST